MYILGRGIMSPKYLIEKRNWKKSLNYKTVLKFSSSKMKRLFKGANEEHINTFKVSVLKKYIRQTFDYSFDSVEMVKKVVKKLNLELAEHEEDYITRLEELAFAKNRVLKQLTVPFRLRKREKCFFKLDTGYLYDKLENGYLEMVNQGTLYMTNERLVVDGPEMSKLELSDYPSVIDLTYGVEMKHFKDHSKSIVIRANDNDLLSIYIERLLDL